MKLENLAKANELAESIRRVDDKINQINAMGFSTGAALRIGAGLDDAVFLYRADIGPEKASEIQNELWDALLKTRADLTAELEKL